MEYVDKRKTVFRQSNVVIIIPLNCAECLMDVLYDVKEKNGDIFTRRISNDFAVLMDGICEWSERAASTCEARKTLTRPIRVMRAIIPTCKRDAPVRTDRKMNSDRHNEGGSDQTEPDCLRCPPGSIATSIRGRANCLNTRRLLF